MRLTREFFDAHDGATLRETSSSAFRNIQITVHENEFALVSKAMHPAAHFVIEYPNMVCALSQFSAPIVDEP